MLYYSIAPPLYSSGSTSPTQNNLCPGTFFPLFIFPPFIEFFSFHFPFLYVCVNLFSKNIKQSPPLYKEILPRTQQGLEWHVRQLYNNEGMGVLLNEALHRVSQPLRNKLNVHTLPRTDL